MVTATMHIHRPIHDGAEYLVSAPTPGVTALCVQDADGDSATVSFDRSGVRQLIDDLSLVAGFTPTGMTLDLAKALEGTVRILFERLDEQLERQDPAAADRIRVAMIAHLRSKAPVLVGGVL